MHMGNYLSVRRICTGTMSASNETFGIQHPTVVPTNFESTETTDAPADAETDETA